MQGLSIMLPYQSPISETNLKYTFLVVMSGIDGEEKPWVIYYKIIHQTAGDDRSIFKNSKRKYNDCEVEYI